MRSYLLVGVCGLVLLIATAGQAWAQESTTSDKKDKNVAEKTADKAEDVGREVGDKAEDVGDKSKKGAKKVVQGAKSSRTAVWPASGPL